MGLNPKIIPPRVDFLDERTGKVSREWFKWLLQIGGVTDDAEVAAAFDAAIGSANYGELSKSVHDLRLLESFPQAQHSNAQDVQDARLGPVQTTNDYSQDIQDTRLLNPRTSTDQTREIEDVRLVSIPAPREQVSAARILARTILRT